MSDILPAKRVYRHRRSLLVGGVCLTVCIMMFVGVGVVGILTNVDGSIPRPADRRLLSMIFGVCCLPFVMIGLWAILLYIREIIEIEPTKLIFRGVFRTRFIDFHQVTHIKWPSFFQKVTIAASSPRNRIKIDLTDYTLKDRDELIAFVHETFPADIQEGWAEFEAAERERRERTGKRSTTTAAICAALWIGFGGVFTWCWAAGLGFQWLVIGVINALVGAWYLWRIRRERLAHQSGESHEPFSTSDPGHEAD